MIQLAVQVAKLCMQHTKSSNSNMDKISKSALLNAISFVIEIPFHWHVPNVTIPCHSQKVLPFLCYVLFLPPSPPTILPSSFTSTCHLFLGLPLNLVVPKFIYNTLLWILVSSILCTCPNQHNLFNLIVPIIVGFFNTCIYFFIS